MRVVLRGASISNMAPTGVLYNPSGPSSGQCAVSSRPVELFLGPHLFLDDLLIASSTNITRTVNMPHRDLQIPNPVVTGREDGCFQPYLTVLHDSKSGRFRIWYGHRTAGYSEVDQHVAYIESEDGVYWIRPHRVLQDPAPIQFGVSVIDEGEEYPHPVQRFKLGWWKDGGLQVATSADGLTWTPMTPGVVLPHNHDIASIFYDLLRKRYLATVSQMLQSTSWSGVRRVTMQSYSQDLLTWVPPHFILTPDDIQEGAGVEFYAMDGFLVRGDLLIGMVKVLRDDLRASGTPDGAFGIGYTTLAWTRDGETWVRDRAHFFDPDPQVGAWDHAHAWIDEQLPVGDDVYLYYGGYKSGHKMNRFEERQIGLVRMKRDRYIAREAGEKTGTLRTPPVIVHGQQMTLNANARGGEVRVQILRSDGHPLPGLSFADCQAITGDHLSAPVRWAYPLADLEGKVIQIEFSLNQARLFSFDLG